MPDCQYSNFVRTWPALCTVTTALYSEKVKSPPRADGLVGEEGLYMLTMLHEKSVANTTIFPIGQSSVELKNLTSRSRVGYDDLSALVKNNNICQVP
jgi:hypothetical protein